MLPLLAGLFLVCAVAMLHRTVTERVEHAASVVAGGDDAQESIDSGKSKKKVSDPEMNAHQPRLYRMLHMGDSDSYLSIARTFAKGDFSGSYVICTPHRQPLYPLLLAIPQRLTGPSPFWFGWVNVLAGLATLLFIYQSSWATYRNGLIAACAGVFCLTNSFLMDEVSGRIMTEPLFILFCVGAIHGFLQYIEHRRRRNLLAAFGFLALSYLTRPNGLLLMGAMGAAVCLGEGVGWLRSPADRASKFRRVRRTALDLALALAVFVVIASPSWVPRWVYLHNPTTHGYLGNFMWVDTYKPGHTGLPYQSFHFADYARSHSLTDALGRWGHGVISVFGTVPAQEEDVPVLFLLAVGGMVAACVRRNRAYGLLFVFFMIEMLPLVWTKPANPNTRVPYSAMFPFELFFAVFALQTVAAWAARVKAEYPGKSVAH
jgi:hypothetical protein